MKKNIYFWLASGLLVYLMDRAVKIYLIKNSSLRWDFLPSFLSIDLTTNQGIAFGFVFNQLAILILTVVIIFALVFWLVRLWQQKKPADFVAIYLIVLGAFSNLLDRLARGYVIDYIDVPFFTVFNLADCLITVGIAVFIIKALFKKNEKAV